MCEKNNMEVFNCKPENIKACSSLLAKVYSESEYGESWNEHDAFKYLERFYRIEPLGCYVAIENGELIGAIFSYSYPRQSETLVYIQELFVSLDYRKKGVATSLLSNVGKEKNIKAWLVAKENTSASKFYEKMGFKQDGPYKFNYGTITT